MDPVHYVSFYATDLEQEPPISSEHLIVCEIFSSNCCHIQRRTTAFTPTGLVMLTAGNIQMSLFVRQRNLDAAVHFLGAVREECVCYHGMDHSQLLGNEPTSTSKTLRRTYSFNSLTL